MLTDFEVRNAFNATNRTEPLSEGWPGLERFAREVERCVTERCLPAGVDADLLKKLERSNDAWINERKENADLTHRLRPIFAVWERWKDVHRKPYPTVEQTRQALYDFGKAIEMSMDGYNPR